MLKSENCGVIIFIVVNFSDDVTGDSLFWALLEVGTNHFIDSSWDEYYDVGLESAFWFIGLLDFVCVIFSWLKILKLMHLLF